MLIKTGNPITTIKANCTVGKVIHLLSKEFEGLDPIVCFNFASKVMLTRNLWIKHFLCDGAIGFVKDVIYKEDQYPPSLPIEIVIHFLNHKGSSLKGSFPLTTIILSSSTTDNMERHQLPLKSCWRITIHKFQGLPILNALIDLGPSEKVAGFTYVTLSRVSKMSDLILEPITLDRLNAVKQTKKFHYRCKKETSLKDIANLTAECYSQEEIDELSQYKNIFGNFSNEQKI